MSASTSVIRHIVCSGGGVTGFSFYGMLRECHKRNLWKLEDIETIYGTSVGSIIAVILALDYDWDTIDDYLIKRPWNNVFKFNLYSIIDSLKKRGIFGMKTIEDTFAPLFNGKDISIDITMQDFYDITKKEIHIFTTDVMRFEVVDISHKTHPEWRLMDAVYASSAIPIIFSPFIKDSKCYCDGAMLLNYPLDKCIENGAKNDEIIGLCNDMNAHDEDIFNESCSLLDYGLIIMKKLICAFLSVREHRIKNEFRITSINMSIYDIVSTTTEIDNRIRLIQEGVDVIANIFTSTDTI
jgi:predicted acylesterase/phospholipase RssA|tara:strand:+ start:360 stop:1247 length:888 start_codon:yes stop_codon:yes gene_type:complete